MIILTIVLLIISAVSKAVMDKLLFHYEESMFKDFDNPSFWNPNISWKNKWKNGNKDEGEKFFLSSTVLVFLTDAWHLFQFLFLNTLMVGFFLLGQILYETSLLSYIMMVLVVILYKTLFEKLFSKILSN